MVEASGRHQSAPIVNGVMVPRSRADELVVGAGLEVLFNADVQLLVGYQRTAWGRNVNAYDTVIITIVPTFL